jgi:hypothetical protein
VQKTPPESVAELLRRLTSSHPFVNPEESLWSQAEHWRWLLGLYPFVWVRFTFEAIFVDVPANPLISPLDITITSLLALIFSVIGLYLGQETTVNQWTVGLSLWTFITLVGVRFVALQTGPIMAYLLFATVPTVVFVGMYRCLRTPLVPYSTASETQRRALEIHARNWWRYTQLTMTGAVFTLAGILFNLIPGLGFTYLRMGSFAKVAGPLAAGFFAILVYSLTKLHYVEEARSSV